MASERCVCGSDDHECLCGGEGRDEIVHDQPQPGWTTELSAIFAFSEASGWVLDPFRRLRWAAHPGFGDDAFPPSDPRSLFTAG